MPRLKTDRIAWRKVGDDLVVLDLETKTYLATNPAATLLWKALEEGATRGHLVRLLTERYGIGADVAGEDVDAFVDDCQARGLLDEDSP